MKKFKFISSLLALVMVLSMITVMPASAATAEEGFFCDFEDTSVAVDTTDYTAIKNAFGVYTRNTDGASSGGVAKIIADTDGNRGIGIDGNGYLYVPAPSSYTSGKAYIGFSVKGSSFGFVKAAFGKIIGGTGNDYKGHYMASIEDSVAPAVSASSTLVNPVARKDGWNDILIVVDIDNSTWTVYMNESKIGDTYSFLDKYDVTKSELGAFYGIGFYEGDKSGEGMIDDISIVCSDGVCASVSADGTVISAVLPQQIAVDANDITVTKCGSTETVDVEEVEYAPNQLNITLADALDSGCEYIVTFDGYEGIEVYAYTAASGNSKTGYYKLDFEGEYSTASFSEYNSSGNLITREVVDNEDINKIIETTVKGNNTLNRVKVMDLSGSANETNASGKVLASLASGTHFYMLDVIGTDVGVETYEFDYKWYWSSQSNKGFLMMSGDDTVNGATEKTILTMNNEDVWHHVKIDYDTEADTLTVTKDGTPTVFTKVPKFDNKLYLYAPTQTVNPVFQIDNYEQYVTGVAPLAVEKVRYTAENEVTGSNLISPATNKIDITFSEEVDSAVANAITLTANGTPVETTATSNGNIVTLTILDNSLPGNADIKLTIPAADRVYDVKTEKVKVTVGGLNLTGAEASGTMSANTSVTVTASGVSATGSANITLIYAFYYDDELVAVDSATKAVTVGTTPEVSNTFTIDKAFSYDEVKAFAWDGLTTIVPLVTSYTVPAE